MRSRYAPFDFEPGASPEIAPFRAHFDRLVRRRFCGFIGNRCFFVVDVCCLEANRVAVTHTVDPIDKLLYPALIDLMVFHGVSSSD